LGIILLLLIRKLRVILIILLNKNKIKLIDNIFNKIYKTYRYVGYGNFNYLNYDSLCKHSKFDKTELKYLDELFYFDAKKYGFFGEKPIKEIDNIIRRKNIVKIKGTGHYLFDGVDKKIDLMVKEAKNKDNNLEIILTSGVRNVSKQMFLFLNKLRKVNYNLSAASRSLAPPGYSFHGVGDFDVGKRKYGKNNFTSKFEKTDEFKILNEIGYLKLRYPKGNKLGVRYEPWHVREDLIK